MLVWINLTSQSILGWQQKKKILVGIAVLRTILNLGTVHYLQRGLVPKINWLDDRNLVRSLVLRPPWNAFSGLQDRDRSFEFVDS